MSVLDELDWRREVTRLYTAVRAERSPAVPNAGAVGDDSALKAPLRSFRFGTERP